MTWSEFAPWVPAVLSVLLGSGGAVAWYQARADSRRGVRDLEIAEDAAASARWQAIVKTQTESLLEPLMKRVGALEVEVAELRREKTEWERRERLWERWAMSLVGHINDRKDPPPPAPPDGLMF